MFQLPASVIAQLKTAEPEGFEVWPGNMPVIDIWLCVQSQWRTSSLATGRVHWHGLDYASARAGLDLAGRVTAPDVWAGVQVMESAAAAALNGYRG